jgi:hypothetical protein
MVNISAQGDTQGQLAYFFPILARESPECCSVANYLEKMLVPLQKKKVPVPESQFGGGAYPTARIFFFSSKLVTE